MRLADLVGRRQVVADLKSRGKLEVLDELSELLSLGDERVSAKEFSRTLLERERLRSTGVGSGVAIPHGKVSGLEGLTMAVGLARGGIDFDSADGSPVCLMIRGSLEYALSESFVNEVFETTAVTRHGNAFTRQRKRSQM